MPELAKDSAGMPILVAMGPQHLMPNTTVPATETLRWT